jgi:glycine cleavage system H protein
MRVRFATWFTKSHEYVNFDDASGVGTVGITDHAQQQLGDIVFVELPEIDLDADTGSDMASIESVKTVATVYAPVDGTVVEVNSGLEDTPELINEAAESDGWLVKMKLKDPAQLKSLMDAAKYEQFCEEDDH